MKIEKDVKYKIELSKIDLEIIQKALGYSLREGFYSSEVDVEKYDKALDIHAALFKELKNV